FGQERLADQIILTHAKSPVHFVRESLSLKRERFDLAVLFPNSIGTALMARMAGIPRIAGYPTDGRRLLLSAPVALDPEVKRSHHVFSYLAIVKALAGSLSGTDLPPDLPSTPLLHPTASRRAEGRQLLSAFGMAPGEPAGKAFAGGQNNDLNITRSDP